MKMKTMCFGFLISLSINSLAQSSKCSIGLQLVNDFDSYSFPSVYYTNQIVKGKGSSVGINLLYKHSLRKQIQILAGSGFYNYKFNIHRGFNYSLDTITNFGYSTKDYAYKCIPLTLGANYDNSIGNKSKLNIGLSYTHFVGLTESYTPSSAPPTGGAIEKNSQSNFSADEILIKPGFERKFNKVFIGIELRVPLWERWKKDDMFKENESGYNFKSFNGIGIGLSIFYSL
jgi:hypothetical protein